MNDWLVYIHYIVTLFFQTLERAYGTLLFIGAFGVAAQAALGFMHGGHGHDAHAHTGDASPAGHAHTGDASPAHHTPLAHHGADAAHHSGDASHGAHNHHGENAAAKSGASAWNWLGLFSPMMIFSVCLGMGAVGLLVRAYLDSIPTGILATVGGFAFYRFAVLPLMSLVLAFSSKPATNLSGTLAREAIATGRFDEQGRGIVQITIDGEVKRLLARLDAEDQKRGVAVASGDRVLVTDVDRQKNTCRVTRL